MSKVNDQKRNISDLNATVKSQAATINRIAKITDGARRPRVVTAEDAAHHRQVLAEQERERRERAEQERERQRLALERAEAAYRVHQKCLAKSAEAALRGEAPLARRLAHGATGAPIPAGDR